MFGRMLRWAWSLLGAIDIVIGLGMAAIITTVTIALLEDIADLGLGWKIMLFVGLAALIAVTMHFATWLFGPRLADWRSVAVDADQPQSPPGSAGITTQGSTGFVIQQGPGSIVIQQGTLTGQEGRAEVKNSEEAPASNPPDAPWSEKPWIRRDQYQDRKFSGVRVRLVDIVDKNYRIKERDFGDCEIEGPGVIVLLGEGALQDCGFEADQDTLFWEVPEDKMVIGAIAVEDCNFTRCNFHGIGIAGTSEQISRYLRGFGFDSDSSTPNTEDSQRQSEP